VSSAILYVAIVAIWACVLIPRWLRRDTSQAKAPKAQREVPGDAAADTDGADAAMEDDDVAVDGLPEAADYEHEHYSRDSREEYVPGGSQTRARMLRARRRMLLVLVTLTVVALGIVAVGMAAWWVAGPPIVMVGGYLLLLREARRADAERAQRLADEAEYRRDAPYQDDAAYREEAAAPAEQEQEAVPEAPEPQEEQLTARVIDISERVVRDELYDQYADAERRAVGD
jgi:Flp pilus assembly protein TadB